MKARLLLVDDEPSILTTLKTLLELWDFQVETAGSAAEAIASLKASCYDMVITDLRMESDDAGFQVARAARETEYQPAVAILSAFPLLAQDWKQHGVQELFIKPTRVRELVTQIEAILAADICPDLLVSDVMMPGLNGFETALQVKQICPRCRLILFTGQMASAVVAEGFAQTFSERGYYYDLLSKPLHPTELIGKVQEVLQRPG